MIETLQDTNIFYVYKITNLINKKIYIGKTSGNFEKRFYNHCKFAFCKSAKNDCPKLYRSMRKYGTENFKYEMIKLFNNEHDAYSFEEKLIDELKSIKYGLNTVRGGKGASSGKNNPMYKKGYLVSGPNNGMFGMVGELNPFFGKKHSPETIKHLQQTKRTLSDAIVAEIRKMLAEKISYDKIAKRFLISTTTVFRIKHNIRY